MGIRQRKTIDWDTSEEQEPYHRSPTAYVVERILDKEKARPASAAAEYVILPALFPPPQNTWNPNQNQQVSMTEPPILLDAIPLPNLNQWRPIKNVHESLKRRETSKKERMGYDDGYVKKWCPQRAAAFVFPEVSPPKEQLCLVEFTQKSRRQP